MHFDSPFCSVGWDDIASAVCLTWKQFPEGEEFREPLLAGVDLLVQKKGRRWLGDTRNLGVCTQEDVRWAADVWTPRATAAGMAYLAFVAPRKVVGQMVIKTFINKVNNRDLLTGYFENIQQARNWLRSQK